MRCDGSLPNTLQVLGIHFAILPPGLHMLMFNDSGSSKWTEPNFIHPLNNVILRLLWSVVFLSILMVSATTCRVMTRIFFSSLLLPKLQITFFPVKSCL